MTNAFMLAKKVLLPVQRGVGRALPPRLQRHYLHLCATGRWGDFRTPSTFNEKVCRRILDDRRPGLVTCCDKQRMKQLARRVVPDPAELAIPETLWFGESFRDLPPESFFPNAVAKPNSGSGSVKIGDLDRETLLRAQAEWEAASAVQIIGEWGYQQADGGVFVEERIGPEGWTPEDYKFFVFDGRVKAIMVASTRFGGRPSFSFYSPDWEQHDVHILGREARPTPAPRNLERMKELAERLGAGWDHIRVDLYTDEETVWFGEFTPYPNGGICAFRPRSFDALLGSWWTVSQNAPQSAEDLAPSRACAVAEVPGNRRGNERAAALMVGPPATSAGGMGSVSQALEQFVAESGEEWSCAFVDSGGGTGTSGYLRFPSAVRAVARRDHDLVHLHVASRGSTARKAVLGAVSRLRGCPYVIHLHGAAYRSFLDGADAVTMRCVRDFFRHAASVVVLGETWKHLVVERLGVPAERVHVVHNGVPAALDVIPDDAVRTGTPTILWMGDVGRRKGFDLLLGALRILFAEQGGETLRVDVAGAHLEPDLIVEAEKLSRDNGGRIRVLGPVFGEDKAELWRHASVFVLPSRAEGLPMVLLEAMSAGVPCVTTTVGSIDEIFPAGAADGAVLLEPPAAVGTAGVDADVQRLADALGSLLRDPAQAARVGHAGRVRWETAFTSSAMGRGVMNVWRDVLKR